MIWMTLELENEVSERDTTIASISLELEKLKEQNEFLQQDFQKQAIHSFRTLFWPFSIFEILMLILQWGLPFNQ